MNYKSIYQRFNEEIYGNNAMTYHRTQLNKNGKGGKFSTYNLPQDLDNLLLNNPILLAWSKDIVNSTNQGQSLVASRSINTEKYVKGSVFDDGKPRLLNDPDTEYTLESEGKEVEKGDTFYKVKSGFDTFKNISWGFQSGSGQMYGRGFYSCFKVGVINKSSGGNKSYGDLLMKFQVSNLSNYLFVDFDEFSKTPRYKEHPDRYDANNYIFMQLQDAGVPFGKISELEHNCGFNISNQNIIETYGRDRFAVDFAPYFEGFVYTGGSNDGDVLVTFDLEWIAKNYLSFISDRNPTSRKSKKGAKEPVRNDIMNSLAKEMSLQTEKQKIENLLRNYDNMKSIYPVEFSIDDGKTWYKIPVSDSIKQKIFALRRAYAANGIKINDVALDAKSILEAYTFDYSKEFNIPFSYLNQGTVTINDITDYLSKNPDLRAIFLTGQNPSYYQNFNSILDGLNNINGLSFYLKSRGNQLYLNEFSKEAEDILAKLQAANCKVFLNNDVTELLSKSQSVDMSLLRLVIIEKDLDFVSESDLPVSFTPLPDGVAFDFVKSIRFKGFLSEQNLDFISKAFPKVKMISYDYNYEKGVYDNVIDLVKSQTTIRKQPKSFDAFKRSSILKRLKYININIKDKHGFAPNLNSLFTEDSVNSLINYLSDNKHKVKIEDVVLSCVKDKALHRDVSTFISDNNVLINNLSLIGDFTVVGNKRTYVNNCCVDFAAFNAVKDHIAVLNTMHVYMPDVPGQKIKITNEFLNSLKKICKFPFPTLYFKGGKIDSQYDISELTPDNDKFFRKIVTKTADWNFYKYINLSKPEVV